MTTANTAGNRIGTLLVLGASGDLSRRLLLPGLASLVAGDWGASRGKPPLLLGSGADELADPAWRSRVKDSFASAGVRSARLTEIVRRTHYHQADVSKADDLDHLLSRCEGVPAIYFALPPAVTALACQALRQVELPEGTVLVMEKPFGVDLESAEKLNRLVATLVPEEQVFRVDHFLGRSDVLNILGLRFANRLMEPVWNNQNVEKIEIVFDEELALEGRAGYYDHAGALKDMIQSHLLQVMAVLLMEPIASLDQRGFRDAKAEVLRATRLFGSVRTSTRRARYTAGRLERRSVPAYTREKGVDPSRRTETLAQVTFEVRNWRWAGVPIVLRSGKALSTPRKEAIVTLKPVPHVPTGLRGTETSDAITIGLKPPKLSILLDVNGPADPFTLDTTTVTSDLAAGDLAAYGEVLAGVLDGDPLLSVRGDNAEECWRIVGPVVRAWAKDEVPMETYPAGSDGPRGWD